MTNLYSSAASNYPRNRSSIVARSMILARGCPLVPALRQAFFFTSSDLAVPANTCVFAHVNARGQAARAENHAVLSKREPLIIRRVADDARSSISLSQIDPPKISKNRHTASALSPARCTPRAHVREVDGFLDFAKIERGGSRLAPRAAETERYVFSRE